LAGANPEPAHLHVGAAEGIAPGDRVAIMLDRMVGVELAIDRQSVLPRGGSPSVTRPIAPSVRVVSPWPIAKSSTSLRNGERLRASASLGNSRRRV
jgi:hypothetical protein